MLKKMHTLSHVLIYANHGKYLVLNENTNKTVFILDCYNVSLLTWIYSCLPWNRGHIFQNDSNPSPEY